jgi:mono/diheme cytochrome c family protein
MAEGPAGPPASKKRHVLRTVVIVLAGIVVVMQLIPYGRDHSNPPVTAEPSWDSAQTRELASTACFDCHSNETEWPWYTNVAPMSWLVQRDVDEGRETLNFSEWDQPQSEEIDEIGDIVLEGEMPPMQYTLLHGAARLSDGDTQALADGLEATMEGSPPTLAEMEEPDEEEG